MFTCACKCESRLFLVFFFSWWSRDCEVLFHRLTRRKKKKEKEYNIHHKLTSRYASNINSKICEIIYSIQFFLFISDTIPHICSISLNTKFKCNYCLVFYYIRRHFFSFFSHFQYYLELRLLILFFFFLCKSKHYSTQTTNPFRIQTAFLFPFLFAIYKVKQTDRH